VERGGFLAPPLPQNVTPRASPPANAPSPSLNFDDLPGVTSPF
jgi:hypothetical protein